VRICVAYRLNAGMDVERTRIVNVPQIREYRPLDLLTILYRLVVIHRKFGKVLEELGGTEGGILRLEEARK
jgi:hypothetical protein